MKRLLSLIIMAAAIGSASASDFFDTSRPTRLFNLGVRLGVNTSNRTVDKQVFDLWNCNSWGTGIDVGAVADLNIRDYISIQPGFFFESRSGNYAYACNYIDSDGQDAKFSQFGKVRSYNFTVPVMASVHFNVTGSLRWNVEAGPYIQIVLKNSKGSDFAYAAPTKAAAPTQFGDAKAGNFDFGFKFGTSLNICRHYYVGVHYMAGWLDAWKESSLGGCNKAWVFSLGYDF